LTEEPVILKRIPRVRDIRTIERLLVDIGSKVEAEGETVRLHTPRIVSPEAPYDLVRPCAPPVWFWGRWWPAAGARAFPPGRLRYRDRPINLHIFGLEQLGAPSTRRTAISKPPPRRVFTERWSTRPDHGHGHGGPHEWRPVLATGETTLRNAAREPEVADLAGLLGKMGAHIEGAGTSIIRIQGVERLHGAEHAIIPGSHRDGERS